MSTVPAATRSPEDVGARVRPGALRSLRWAAAAGALADGICVAVIASRAVPHVQSLGVRVGLALACFLVPHALAALLRLVRPLRSCVRGWDATGVLVVGFFLRAGFVLLLALAQTLVLLCAVAFVVGCFSAVGGVTVDVLHRRLAAWEGRKRPPVMPRALNVLLGAAGLAVGVLLTGGGSPQVCFYAGAVLFLLAAFVGSGVGRVEE
jgi:hypothetical protein